jgi:flagellar biogenesis protein FliO
MSVPQPFIVAVAAGKIVEPSLGGTQGPDLTRYVVVCGGLLLVIAALALGFRKWIARTVAARAARRSLAVIDVLPLSNKHKLAVVRCYDRTFVLGLGEREMSLVTELDAAIEPQREAAPSRADSSAFAQVLARVRPAVPKAAAAPREFVA